MWWTRFTSINRYLTLALVLALGYGIAGCGQKSAHMILGKNDVTFYGESNNWNVTYGLDYPEGNKEKSQIVLQYKGPAAKSVGEVNFLVEDDRGSLGSTRTLPDTGVIILDGGSSSASAKPSESAKARATVKWKGSEETIELHLKK